MCGRYVLEFDHDVYLGGEPLGADIHNFNVAPTTTVPILLERFTEESSVPTREIYPARWGLLPGWAKDASFSARTFNARSETLFEKPSFRHAALNGHCAIPVSGYYEWKTEQLTSGKQTKTPTSSTDQTISPSTSPDSTNGGKSPPQKQTNPTHPTPSKKANGYSPAPSSPWTPPTNTP